MDLFYVPGKGFLDGLMLYSDGLFALSLAFSAFDRVGEGGPNREWKVPANVKKSGMYLLPLTTYHFACHMDLL